jgi:DNA-binding transcriptional regulator PaaX
MATLNLRDASRNGAGQLEPSASYRDSIDHVTARELRLTEPSLEERIYIFVRDAGVWVSRAQIAKGIGLKKTPYVNQAIERLVSDGWIERASGTFTNRALMYWYRLADQGAAQ